MKTRESEKRVTPIKDQTADNRPVNLVSTGLCRIALPHQKLRISVISRIGNIGAPQTLYVAENDHLLVCPSQISVFGLIQAWYLLHRL